MGSGASHSQVQRIDKSNQMPSIPETISEPRSSVSPSLFKSDDRLFTHVPHKSKRRRPSTQEGLFELDPNIEEYSAIWDHDTKVSYYFTLEMKLYFYSYHQHFNVHQNPVRIQLNIIKEKHLRIVESKKVLVLLIQLVLNQRSILKHMVIFIYHHQKKLMNLLKI
jgi:hypothetical protein